MTVEPTYKELQSRVKELEKQVVEYKSKYENLLKNEARFETAIESLPFDFFAIDEDGRYVMQNAVCREHWGELIGKRPEDIDVDEETLSVWQNNNRRAFGGEVVRGEVRYKTNGEEEYFYNIISPVYMKGRVQGILGVNIDITDQKRDEEALLESERRLKESQKISRLGQWELDLATNNLYWSEGIYDLFGINPEEFGASYEAFLDAIHPDDREFVDNAYTESVKKRVPYDIVHRLLLKDGTVKYVNEICRTEYDEDGNPLRSLGTVQDITERMQAEEALRESEERLKEAQEMGRIGHWEYDLDTQKTTWSDMIYKFHELEPNQHPSDYNEEMIQYAPEESEHIQKKVLRAIKTGESITLDFRATSPSGKTAYYCSTFHPIKDETGRVTKVRGTQQEITERKLAEEKLEKQAHNLEETNAALRVLLNQRDLDKKEFEEKVVFNVKELVFPYVEKLKTKQLNDMQMVYVDIIESHLNDIIAPFLHRLSSKYSNLTPSEIKVANFVKDGRTTKEIAELLNLSNGAIAFHRNNLRKKLGLRNKKTNLRAHLLSLA